ncbi:MAG: FixH family protein [Azoarcus sp.]|nr:FixH family protein [Azoarcus sp.]
MFAVFAAVLSILLFWPAAKTETGNSLPWRQQPWPWFLIALPVIAVIGGITTAVFAVRSNDGLVTKDYYKEGLAVVKQVAYSERARELGLSATATVREGAISVKLSSAQDKEPPATLYLRIIHPTREGFDQEVMLPRTPDGLYSAPVEPLQAGRWRFLLANLQPGDGDETKNEKNENESRGWRMNGAANIPAETEVLIRPSDSKTVEGGVAP